LKLGTVKPHERRAIANRETDGVIYPPGWVSAVRLIVHRAGRRNLETAHPSTAFDVWGAVIAISDAEPQSALAVVH
jgi:hypothetical protein